MDPHEIINIQPFLTSRNGSLTWFDLVSYFFFFFNPISNNGCVGGFPNLAPTNSAVLNIPSYTNRYHLQGRLLEVPLPGKRGSQVPPLGPKSLK